MVSPRIGSAGTEQTIHSRCVDFFERIKVANPQLHAFTELLEPSALDAASTQDDRREKGHNVGCLSGLTAAVKNNIDTKPAVASAGLSFLKNHRPASDATVVRLLRDNGAIILGVTDTDSGAFGVTTPSVKNPVYPDRFVGGSSGGSAAAVAAGLCDFAIGTDTGGSVRIPAACCSVFGFKPTSKTVSLDGVRPLTHSFDHIGLLTRQIDIISRVLQVLSQAPKDSRQPIDDKMSIGIPWNSIADAETAVLQAIENFAEIQTKAGFEITSVKFPAIDDLLEMHIHLSLREAAELNRDLPQEHLSELPDIATASLQIGNSVDDPRREALNAKKSILLSEVNVAMDEVDFIILPTLPILPPRRLTSRVRLGVREIDLFSAMIRYTAIFNQTGNPALAFPWAGRDASVLSSLQLVGKKYSDFQLIDFARKKLNLDFVPNQTLY